MKRERCMPSTTTSKWTSSSNSREGLRSSKLKTTSTSIKTTRPKTMNRSKVSSTNRTKKRSSVVGFHIWTAAYVISPAI